ncbi:MAG: gamma-glutamylcyclotransferase [SAR324 cluster bacterium]|nr:gamma-glutamylcyclotransferase [SAR324 cluster bacterium]
MREVSGGNFSHVSGILKNYSRRSVRGEYYPALLSHTGSSVEGVVYTNVTKEAWIRLDRFEGEMYTRQLVQIELNDGIALPAFTYIVHKNYLDRLDLTEWDFKNFLGNGKMNFLKHYKGYQSL